MVAGTDGMQPTVEADPLQLRDPLVQRPKPPQIGDPHSQGGQLLAKASARRRTSSMSALLARWRGPAPSGQQPGHDHGHLIARGGAVPRRPSGSLPPSPGSQTPHGIHGPMVLGQVREERRPRWNNQASSSVAPTSNRPQFIDSSSVSQAPPPWSLKRQKVGFSGLPQSCMTCKFAAASSFADRIPPRRAAAGDPNGACLLSSSLGPDESDRRDLSGNTERILQTMQEARALGTDLLAFPELA